MRVTVGEGRLRVDLAPDHAGPRWTPDPASTAYLGKYGVLTEWGAPGELLGFSMPAPEGVEVEGGYLLDALMLPARTCHDPAHP